MHFASSNFPSCRIAHDISLDNLSCLSEENNDPDLDLTSTTLDGSTKRDSPVNYLEHSFSVNIKNATNLLGIDIIKTPPTGSLRIEDIEKLELGIKKLNTEEERTERSNQDVVVRNQNDDITDCTGQRKGDVVDQSRCLRDTTGMEEAHKRAPKRSEEEEQEEASQSEAGRPRASVLEVGCVEDVGVCSLVYKR